MDTPTVLRTPASRPAPRTPYVHVMTGLPASGKTTAARALLAQAEGRMRRINLDDLRSMLDPPRPDGHPMWSSAHEETTVAMQDALIREAVLAGYDVVVDNTHLTERTTEHLKTAVGRIAWFVVHDLTGVPIEECIARDAERATAGGQSVGEDVIRLLARNHAAAREGGWQLTEQWLNERHDAARAGAHWARLQAANLADREGKRTA